VMRTETMLALAKIAVGIALLVVAVAVLAL
jgi:hypothetical protein